MKGCLGALVILALVGLGLGWALQERYRRMDQLCLSQLQDIARDLEANRKEGAYPQSLFALGERYRHGGPVCPYGDEFYLYQGRAEGRAYLLSCPVHRRAPFLIEMTQARPLASPAL